jgi:hypothetical protein
MNDVRPIDQLPTEVLGAIFVRGLQQECATSREMEEGHDYAPQTLESYAFLQIISSVSRRRRDVALNTGTLWASIDLSLGLPLKRAKTFLGRSKQCCPHFHCEFEPAEVYVDGQRHLAEALSIIRTHAPRVTSLSFLVSPPPLRTIMKNLMSGPAFPLWTTLRIFVGLSTSVRHSDVSKGWHAGIIEEDGSRSLRRMAVCLEQSGLF